MKETNTTIPTDFFCFESQINNSLAKAKVHYHNSFEIYYLLKGTCWYFIDQKSYRLTAGDIALIPNGVIHKTNYETKNHSRMLINCSHALIPESVKNLIPELPYFSNTDATADQISEIFNTIQKEYNYPDEFSADILKNKLSELLLLIARESKVTLSKKNESPIVESAVKYIHNHYMDTINLSDVAKYCYVSREHLSRTFKKETGFGFNEYLNVYRLKKADSLLRENPKRKISEIALSCGFNDSNYFSKSYKKMYGIAPTKTKGNKGE